jgi:hypothetical protein
VKTSFDNSTPTSVLAWNPTLRSLDFPLTAIISIAGREREEEPADTKVIEESLRDYAQQDLSIMIKRS